MPLIIGDILSIRTGKLERERGVMPCPGCGVNASLDCGYGVWDYEGDFDCEAPDIDGEPCDDCHHLWCNDCKLKNAMEFQKEEFDVS